MSGRTRRARGLDVLRDGLSGRDLAIVGQVADLRLMTARQIEVVHFPPTDHENAAAAARACRRTLERLHRERLLIRLERRIGGARAGSASFIYALGPVGHRVLALSTPRPRFREPSATFADHTLAVTQTVVDLTTHVRAGRCDLLIWQPEPVCWRTFSLAAAPAVLRPDLFVAVGVDEFEYRWFCEIDRGTEHLPALLRKCRTYEQYYASGREQAAHGTFGQVCWIVPTQARADRLRTAIIADRRLTDALFCVTTVDRAIGHLCGGDR